MRVEVNGVRLFVDIEGLKLVPDGPRMKERPTLILLHGGPGVDHVDFKPAFSQLTDVSQVVYYDQRGHGRSDAGTPQDWNLAQWADDLVALCDALGIERPVVMGLSFGGYVAAAYATRHPSHPGKLIFASTRARAPEFDRALPVFERLGGPEARDVAARYFDGPSEENLRRFAKICLPLYNRAPRSADELARLTRTPAVTEHFRAGELRSFNYLAGLRDVRCPTLVLGGEDDPMVPIQDQVDIAAALPAQLVEFHRIAGAGHGPHRDDPRVFDLIRRFLTS